MDIEQFKKLAAQMQKAGHMQEILGSDGKIEPSKAAIQHVKRESGDADDAEMWRLAQAQTLIELAEKYKVSLN